MVNFVHVSSLVEDLTLNITSASSSSVKILQWQCVGEVETSTENGVQITDENFLSKAKDFLKLIKEKNPDLVLTPEYSFPYAGINYLISDTTLWPKNGTLFCLGAQGENIHRFKEQLNEWERNENIIVIHDAIMNLKEEKNFVSPLLYFFVLNGNLYILPQIKTGNMLDKWRGLEASDMCLGKHIFVFDDKTSTNKFLSIICADVLHITANLITNKVSGNLTIFHPQLNNNPRNEYFTSFRKEILDANQSSNRIITLNWASDTTVKSTPHSFDKPWSAFYKKHSRNIQDDHRKLRIKNIKQGIYFAYNGINEYWYSDRYENIKLYSINKSDTGNARGPATHGYEPIVHESYIYSSSWTPYNGPFDSDILLEALKAKKLEEVYLFPVNALPEEADKVDFFFGACFGHFEEGEIETNGHELVSRMIVGSDSESDERRRYKLHQFLLLTNNLRRGNLPQSLSYLKDNHQFAVDEDFPEQGNLIYNLSPKEEVSFKYPEALVVITDKTEKTKIKQLVSELSKKMSKKLRNQLIVYYQPLGESDFVFYDEHLNETEIQNPSYSKNMTDISNAK